jgi:hypothetical protein
MLVRAARGEPRPRHVTRLAAARVTAVLAAGLATASCVERAASATIMSWTLTPAAPTVGPATLTVTLRDSKGAAVTRARVRLEGHMSHPGMTPAVADALERTPGVYVAPFTFSMPGDWVLLVSAALPDGESVEERIDVANIQPSG